ncbi:MAG TPA: tRNA (adenosine(37)-N6)-threonylcarbamoyltransferase complex dimerization subunit type 1 TsaB [Micropepsaceae bacterium]|nr:tRNA (adenosine(37)-N6)-threonylcarbamoyltransferase complex dimerization subunit type 1 TsaB [Micropepsaceae bacterium]
MPSPLNILALDTALGACSAAVLSSERVIAEEHEIMLRGHAEALAPMVQRVMRDAGLPFSQLQRLAVTVGPGTFTGQRVGLAFARALAVALKIPVIGTTTLEALAEEALATYPQARWAVVAADAKRDEIYLCVLAAEGVMPISPQLVAIGGAPAMISASVEFGSAVILAGTGAAMIKPLLDQAGVKPVDSGIRQPKARYVAVAADRRPRPEGAKPLYLRLPDARLPGGRM